MTGVRRPVQQARQRRRHRRRQPASTAPGGPLCRKNKAQVVPFEIGLDAIAVIVTAENTFLTNATTPTPADFLAANYWSEVNPVWPNEPIARYLPSPTSGTLDYFTNAVFDQQLHESAAADLGAILQAPLSEGALNTIEKEKPSTSAARRSCMPWSWNAWCSRR